MKRFLFKQKFLESLPKSFSKTLLAISLGLILSGIFVPFPKVPKQHSVPLVFHFTEHYALYPYDFICGYPFDSKRCNRAFSNR